MLIETIRSIIGSFARHLPYFPGLGSAYRLLNRWFIRNQANPLAEVQMKNGTSMKVDLRTLIEIDAYYRAEYDAHLINTITSLLDVNAVFLDVGANIGFYSLAIAKEIQYRNGSGFVLAFEPFPGNLKRLVENLENNRLAHLVHVYNFGLSNSQREEFLTLREDLKYGSNTGNASIAINEDFDAGFHKISIRVDKLDSFWSERIANGKCIDIIKVDIEGHEDFFLEGAVDTIVHQRPTILMEVNKGYYRARGLDFDDRFYPLLPQNYAIFRYRGWKWNRVESFRDCRSLDNVFLIPKEKVGRGAYRMFV